MNRLQENPARDCVLTDLVNSRDSPRLIGIHMTLHKAGERRLGRYSMGTSIRKGDRT